MDISRWITAHLVTEAVRVHSVHRGLSILSSGGPLARRFALATIDLLAVRTDNLQADVANWNYQQNLLFSIRNKQNKHENKGKAANLDVDIRCAAFCDHEYRPDARVWTTRSSELIDSTASKHPNCSNTHFFEEELLLYPVIRSLYPSYLRVLSRTWTICKNYVTPNDYDQKDEKNAVNNVK